jgi:hypothetical protein
LAQLRSNDRMIPDSKPAAVSVEVAEVPVAVNVADSAIENERPDNLKEMEDKLLDAVMAEINYSDWLLNP